jgi:hypothetical protein
VIVGITVSVAVRRRNASSVLVAVIVDHGRRVRRIPFRFLTNVRVGLNHAVACGIVAAAGSAVCGARISGIRIVATATGPDANQGEQAQGS